MGVWVDRWRNGMFIRQSSPIRKKWNIIPKNKEYSQQNGPSFLPYLLNTKSPWDWKGEGAVRFVLRSWCWNTPKKLNRSKQEPRCINPPGPYIIPKNKEYSHQNGPSFLPYLLNTKSPWDRSGEGAVRFVSSFWWPYTPNTLIGSKNSPQGDHLRATDLLGSVTMDGEDAVLPPDGEVWRRGLFIAGDGDRSINMEEHGW
jgi:hypothetical protein